MPRHLKQHLLFNRWGHCDFIPQPPQQSLDQWWSQFRFVFLQPMLSLQLFSPGSVVRVSVNLSAWPSVNTLQAADWSAVGFGRGAVCLQSLPSETSGRVGRRGRFMLFCFTATTQAVCWWRLSCPPPPYLFPAQSPGWAESDLLQLDVASPTHQNCSCKSNQSFFFTIWDPTVRDLGNRKQ